MPGLVSKNKTRDALTLMRDGAAITASAAATVGGSAKVLDLANDNPVDGIPETRFECLVDLTAFDIVGNDERYEIVVQGSPDDDFGTAANIVELAMLSVGASETKITDSDADDAVGRYRLFGVNERNGTTYRYLRVYTVVTGATGSITYTAWLTPIV